MKRQTFLKVSATGAAGILFPKSFVKMFAKQPEVLRIAKTMPTLQVVVNPKLRRGTKVHDNAFKALKDLGADHVRYVPWRPYPKLAVPELQSPKDGKTSWDFSLIDPMMIDFMDAMQGHSVMINFSTIPEWMFKTPKPVSYPDNPNQVDWNYQAGTKLKDPTFKQVANYYARIMSWYTKGGFTDEYGKYHKSGHHFNIPYWEVLNEIADEHKMSPQMYTKLYDEIVLAMKKVSPTTKFAGLALGGGGHHTRYFEYFLNHDNHKPGVPLDYVTYHFYASAEKNEPEDSWEFSFFKQADDFLDIVRYVEDIRKRLSPKTKTDLVEIGAINRYRPLPDFFWNLSGALYAYLFGHFSHLGIDIVGESQLVAFPTQYPSVSMVNWENGKPNARFMILKLIHDHFGPGDKIIRSDSNSHVYTYAVIGKDGIRRMMLVNKKNDRTSWILTDKGKNIKFVDQHNNKINIMELHSNQVSLNGYAVAVVTFS